MQKRFPFHLLAGFSAFAILCGCVAPTADIIRTLYDPAIANLRLSNILVISAAGDYPERLRVEQEVASALTTDRTTATPYFAIVGRNAQITRNLINTAIRSRQFDGVLIVRVQGQDVPNAAPGRPTGRNFHLFLYDYAEFNQPSALPANVTIAFNTEFYTTWNEKKVWAIDSLTFDHKTTEEALTLQIESIVSQVQRDRLTAN